MGDWGARGGGGSFELCSATDFATSSNYRLVTASAAADTKGSWIEIEASTRVDSNWLTIYAQPSSGLTNFLFDVGIGAVSSEQVVIPNVQVPAYGQFIYNVARIGFPFDIPKGTRVVMRVQADASPAKAIRAGLSFSTLDLINGPGFQRCTSYGADTGNTTGTAIDPGGVANTEGAYAPLIASTDHRIRGLWVSLNRDGKTTHADGYHEVDVAIGAAASEVNVVEGISLGTEALNDSISQPWSSFFPVNVPAGSRLSARDRSGITTVGSREMSIVAHCLD